MMHRLNLNGYEPDRHHEAAVAFCIHAGTDELTSPVHQHRKGQLILALHGAITCTVENALWMVPPQYAVWIPGGVKHSNQVTANAELCFLFIEPSAVTMPTTCCTLKISPLCRELILTLANRTTTQRAEPMTRRLIQVLFDELPQQPQQQLYLPVSSHPKIRTMVEMMAKGPVEWGSLGQWAGFFAMSERNLARLIVKETGLSFRQWRQQLQLIMALQGLVKGDTVQKVAHTLGYDSTTAFITMFKKGLGQTPGRYIAGLTTVSPQSAKPDPRQ
ncbi:DNA-binding transcriptional regulator NimR [Escherichia coli]|uniref:DNA-binding transcriptional regulator NimR n=1 Tax=Escherichia coli TaxID=562 RepID=UPI00102D7BA4|nr:DNA-binding transcriptional regulator NimR [Escherichia coli]MEB6763956.1 DNA-binding transcriptional regulator NimR [Escherichia coli]RZY11462.1 AraC family transcriptional regulator [Escherichia coli]